MVLFKTSAGLQEVFSWNASPVYYVISDLLYVLFCDLLEVCLCGFHCGLSVHAIVYGSGPCWVHWGALAAGVPSGSVLLLPDVPSVNAFMFGIKGCENK